MEPPKIIREVESGDRSGCWMGCFGIGCLVMVIGFIALIVGSWYGIMHTSYPLVLIERDLEKDGRVKIEGLKGSISDGVSIEELKFLTDDDEHWSVLRGVKFDYNGFMDMARNNRFVVEQMTVESGVIYARIEGPDDFLFSIDDLDSINRNRNSDLSEVLVNLIQIKDLKIINLDTDYSIQIEEASLKNFVARDSDGAIDFGDLIIKSNMLEAQSELSDRWPDRPNAKRIRGVLHKAYSDRLKQDVDFSIDLDLSKESKRQVISLFKNSWVQDFADKQRSVRLTDFSPDDYITSNRILPQHINLQATHRAESSDTSSSRDGAEADRPSVAWELGPGGSFQLGKTTFQIQSASGNTAPFRSIVGTAEVNGETMTGDLRLSKYFQRGRTLLTVGQSQADRNDWAQVVYGASFDSLPRDEQRLIEATISASAQDETVPAEPERGEDKEKPALPAEAENSSSEPK